MSNTPHLETFFNPLPLQKSTLSLMLYLADNLAYIPYTVVDEPLFVIHQTDIMISVAGSNLLQTFKEVRVSGLFKNRYMELWIMHLVWLQF